MPLRRSIGRKGGSLEKATSSQLVGALATKGKTRVAETSAAKALVKTHRDRSLYFSITILALAIVNITFMIKDLGPTLKKDDANSEEEKKHVKHVLDFSNALTASLHSTFFVANLYAISDPEIHLLYHISTLAIIINLICNVVANFRNDTLKTNTIYFISGTAGVNIMMVLFRYIRNHLNKKPNSDSQSGAESKGSSGK